MAAGCLYPPLAVMLRFVRPALTHPAAPCPLFSRPRPHYVPPMPLQFTLRQLEYLTAVANCGLMALAAERVTASPLSISTAIARFLTSPSRQLIMRWHAREPSLISGGQSLADLARQVLARVSGLTDRAAEIARQVASWQPVGCRQTFVQVVLPRMRRSIIDQCPATSFSKSECDQDGSPDDVRRAQYDVVLAYGLQTTADRRYVPPIHLAPYALLAEEHPVAARAGVPRSDMSDSSIVLPQSAGYFLSIFRDARLEPQSTERSHNLEVMLGSLPGSVPYVVGAPRLLKH